MKPRHLIIALMLSASISAFGLRSTTSSALQLPEQPTIEQLQKVNQDMIREVEILREEDEQMQHQFKNLEEDFKNHQESNWRNDYLYQMFMAIFLISVLVFGLFSIIAFLFLGRKVDKLKNDNLELKDYLLRLKNELSYLKEKRLIEIESTNESGLFSQAVSAKDPFVAIELYTKLISINPSPILFINRGVARMEINDRQGAIDDFDKAINMNPLDARAYINRGALMAERHHNEEALEDFTKAIDINPQSHIAYFNRGKLFAGMGDEKRAIWDIEKAVELLPNDSSAAYLKVIFQSLFADDPQNLKKIFMQIEQELDSKPYLSVIATRRRGKRNGNEQDGEEDYISPLGKFDQIIPIK